MAESHTHFVEAEWVESALWAKAWQHVWTRNAWKQYKWMNQMLPHYRTKQESLWVVTRREGRKGDRKRRR